MVDVFVVDDSAVMRTVLTELLQSAEGIDVIGSAPDPLFAMQKFQKNWPDVIVLDIEMPRMDGLTFLKKLMQERPTPVVICSSLTSPGSHKALEALELGAVEVMSKPKTALKQYIQQENQRFFEVIQSASRAKLCRLANNSTRESVAKDSKELITPQAKRLHLQRMQQTKQLSNSLDLIAIGASTGGTQALTEIFQHLPNALPPIVVVQHMPPVFTETFAHRLNEVSDLTVQEAKNGDLLQSGQAFIAPGGLHTQVVKQGDSIRLKVKDGPSVNRHKPSVDVLFKSVAKNFGKKATGVLLTGMGADGARGLLDMRNLGAYTVAQDEESCVVFGMPFEAIEMGGANDVLSLTEIVDWLKCS